jgi:hypothetical protein
MGAWELSGRRDRGMRMVVHSFHFWSSGALVATHPAAGASAATRTTRAGQQARDGTTLRVAGSGSELEARD